IELAYNSNAIEGNTLTLLETRMVIEDGITIRGKPLREHFEAINHQKAFSFLEGVAKPGTGVTEDVIREIHRLILSGIEDDYAGRYRDANVRITGAVKSPPRFEKVPGLMAGYVKQVKENPGRLNDIEMAAFVHYGLVEIHPFIDGNGRTARLVMNLFLMGRGFPIAIVLKTDRRAYYDRLKSADEGDMKPFVDFIGRCVERSLSLYLDAFDRGPGYVSLADAAKKTPYSQEYLSLLARRGAIDALKMGRNWVVKEEAVGRYMKATKKD
ncbi:MAG: Fic family protein, partial [Candidatus Aenigmatarchaeota archaeon]